MTNLSTRVGDYATTGHPVFAPVDSHSFYVLGYFEETKLRHIRIGDPAQIILYSNQQTLKGHVASIGRAIVDQSVEQGTGLVANIKPNIPWVRLAQRVPVRIAFDTLPADVTLGLRHHLHCLNWRAVMNLQTLSWRALPGLKPPGRSGGTHCATASRCVLR